MSDYLTPQAREHFERARAKGWTPPIPDTLNPHAEN